MSTETKLNSYAKGLELAESGKYQDALTHMQQHLKNNPGDAEALNDVGAILYCLGRNIEAIEHFTKSIKSDKDFGEAYWNLVEAYLSCRKPQKASLLFDDMARLKILNADVVNRTANQFLEQDSLGAAIEMMILSLELSNKQDILLPMIEVVRSKRPKIAFFGTPKEDEFYKYINQRYMTECFSEKSQEQLPDLINWCDIAWFDSDEESLSRTAVLPKTCKIAVKLNSLSGQNLNTATEKIDKLIIKSDVSGIENITLIDLEKEGKLVTIPDGYTNKKLNQVLLCLEKEIQS